MRAARDRQRSNGQVACRCATPLLTGVQAYLRARTAGETPPAGSSEAWARFFRKHDPRIRQFAAGFLTARSDRDDCVQEVWAELVVRLPRFRYDAGRADFDTWLYKLVQSKAVDRFRAAQTRLAEPLDAHVDAILATNDQVALDAESTRHRNRAMVVTALAALQHVVSSRNYRVIEMRWLEGQSVSKVARALRMTQSQVWWQEYRMRAKLRALVRRFSDRK